LAAASTTPTGYLFPYDNSLHVDYIDTAGRVNEMWSSDGLAWHWNPLSQNYGGLLPVSDLSAYTFAKDNSQHIVYTTNNHHIWELVYTPGHIIRPPRT
jgi:hypothetical protein